MYFKTLTISFAATLAGATLLDSAYARGAQAPGRDRGHHDRGGVGASTTTATT